MVSRIQSFHHLDLIRHSSFEFRHFFPSIRSLSPYTRKGPIRSIAPACCATSRWRGSAARTKTAAHDPSPFQSRRNCDPRGYPTSVAAARNKQTLIVAQVARQSPGRVVSRAAKRLPSILAQPVRELVLPENLTQVVRELKDHSYTRGRKPASARYLKPRSPKYPETPAVSPSPDGQ